MKSIWARQDVCELGGNPFGLAKKFASSNEIRLSSPRCLCVLRGYYVYVWTYIRLGVSVTSGISISSIEMPPCWNVSR